jgi:NAD(P)-dependent dehydrogenase (short-subunit alcohol dehydrogenase family)
MASALRTLVVVPAVLLALAGTARADIVRLNHGRTMVVDVCRFEGDTVILVLPGGGEVRAHKDLVAEILPEEVPRAREEALIRLSLSPSAARMTLSEATVRRLVDEVAARVGVDVRLAHAVVRAESNYRPLAVSPKGAMGLMQIMPALAASYDLADPFDAESNLETGLRHLRRLLVKYDVRRALAAYNAGEGAVSRYGGVPPYRETQTYVQRIMASLR